MDARQGLCQIAVALVGDEDGGPGFGDQKIGAGDADIGSKKPIAQDGARLVAELARFGEWARRIEGPVRSAKSLRDLLPDEVDRRRDQMAWRLAPQLDDVFAEVGLDRDDAVSFEMFVEADLLGNHRLALGDRHSAGGAAD